MTAGIRLDQKLEIFIGGRAIDCFSLIVDGVYRPYRIFLKTIETPTLGKENHFCIGTGGCQERH